MQIDASGSFGRPPHPISCHRHEMSLSPKGRGWFACGGFPNHTRRRTHPGAGAANGPRQGLPRRVGGADAHQVHPCVMSWGCWSNRARCSRSSARQSLETVSGIICRLASDRNNAADRKRESHKSSFQEIGQRNGKENAKFASSRRSAGKTASMCTFDTNRRTLPRNASSLFYPGSPQPSESKKCVQEANPR
jgi:hypothetical protein